MKNYIGMSRDHSGSMYSLARAAQRDYNDSIAAIKEAATANNQDTIVSVVRCGGNVTRETVNSNVQVLQPITSYSASGGTPLFESILELIKILKAVPDYDDENVSFLVLATTDGQATDTHRSAELVSAIKELQGTDRWTFVFRVPRGYSRDLTSRGIQQGNILEWDQTERGMQQAAQANTQAFSEYMTNRSAGMKSTTKFYANLADVDLKDVQAALVDVSNQVQFFPVSSAENEMQIREFAESKLGGAPMVKGGAFYQLVKTEPKVQDYKRIAIRAKADGKVYAGDAARDMLALPKIGTCRLAPDELGDFEVYIQSTSTNRKVAAGTKLMYWKDVGVAFKEGPSAR